MSKTLSSVLEAEVAKASSRTVTVFDFYLRASIVTPWGTTATLRLTAYPGGFAFFTPNQDPEPSGTRGNAATYNEWPIDFEVIESSSKFQGGALEIHASNVTADFAEMLASIEWEDTPVVVRILPNVPGLVVADGLVIYSGVIEEEVITPEAIAFTVTPDFPNLEIHAPREDMHDRCRFGFCSDMCSKIRFHTENYKAGTVGSGSTVSNVVSSAFSEDTTDAYWNDADEAEGDWFNTVADGSITTSNEMTSLSATVTVDTVSDRINWPLHGIPTDTPVQFTGGTAPAPLALSTTYYTRFLDRNTLELALTSGGAKVNFTSAGASPVLACVNGFHGYQCKMSKPSHWKINDLAQWGTETQGFMQIADAQAGLANAALTPYIQIDLGAGPPVVKAFFFQQVKSLPVFLLPRLVHIFSSTDASTWVFRGHHELPPVNGTGGIYNQDFSIARLWDAPNHRYWRVCVRSKWGDIFGKTMLGKIKIPWYVGDYWRNGTLTFASNTTTVALRNVSRGIARSMSGAALLDFALPAAPVSGDTFVIERGCDKSLNNCFDRQNWENFGGLPSIIQEEVVR